ncbi:two-component regulator propeller domain-containing protein [Algoriphagus boritolerans]|uniref:two-component regulator propeller domain-containing protein n=1 Tax=Algoriphagus boritolerans TaxID=308111 RepID=UPI000A5A7B5F
MGNDFYVQQAERGLSRLEADEIKLIPNTEIFGKERISVILPFLGDEGTSLLLGGRYTGFYLLEGDILSKFPTEVDQLFKSDIPLRGAIVYKGNYILRLFGAGILIMNPQGKILKRIGTEQGLPSDIITSIYPDQNEDLWATTDDGLARIAINSPIQTFGKESGINSAVRNIQKQGQDIFLGTSTGLLKIDASDSEFKPVPQMGNYSIYDSWADGEDMIVIEGGPVNVIRNGKIIRVYEVKDGKLANRLLIPKNHPNLLLVTGQMGIMVYQRGLSKEFPWEYMGNVPGVESAGYIFEGKDGTIFFPRVQEAKEYMLLIWVELVLT